MSDFPKAVSYDHFVKPYFCSENKCLVLCKLHNIETSRLLLVSILSPIVHSPIS